ncbi:MAG: hypothetical protein L7U87_04820, partial [Chlamydiales bacterium]|nr:hypothetical protein [Chlamydiales bacterium]
SLIAFPISIYNLIHVLIGKVALLPASTPQVMGLSRDYALKTRRNISLDNDWKVKRISLKVDGYIIDAAIMGKESTFSNGRWLLSSNGNGEFYENKIQSYSFKNILTQLEGSAIVFNYPGVGASSGVPNREAMSKAYQAILNFLEDRSNGIGATEIIAYGHSIGGGVQGDALCSHKLKKGIKYCFVKSRTFSDLSTAASYITRSKILGFLVYLFGWNISSIDSSRKLQAPEIILQTAAVGTYTDLQREEAKIVHDDVIPAQATLASKLLEEEGKLPFAKEKYFIGIPEFHSNSIYNPEYLVEKINEMLKRA